MMAKTSYFSMTWWWWSPLCARATHWVGFV